MYPWFSDQASGENAAEAGKAAKFFADMSWKFARRQERDPVRERAPVLGPMAASVDALGARARSYHREVTEFVREEILPVEQRLREHTLSEDWATSQRIEALKSKARAAGLWNLFVPLETDPDMRYGKGLTNLEYAHICEVTAHCEYTDHDDNVSGDGPLSLRPGGVQLLGPRHGEHGGADQVRDGGAAGEVAHSTPQWRDQVLMNK